MTREDVLKTAASVWLQICPQCHQRWFIGAAQAADPYRCKSCGCDFVIGYEHLPPLNDDKKTALVKH
ncbi:MAG: hypothetical protein HYR56_05915 [Acidobacteria bacterium]|nr:hypothetical protein [Acidobacteriota bacterium]MBI3424704.1 hypothetical protein [Acidobacteriota bacterium]